MRLSFLLPNCKQKPLSQALCCTIPHTRCTGPAAGVPAYLRSSVMESCSVILRNSRTTSQRSAPACPALRESSASDCTRGLWAAERRSSGLAPSGTQPSTSCESVCICSLHTWYPASVSSMLPQTSLHSGQTRAAQEKGSPGQADKQLGTSASAHAPH